LYDAVIIGAGVGGLSCAAKLAINGKKVLILEKIHHIGGTSHIFKRGQYSFPMGPLSFSFPNLVKHLINEMGVKEDITFERNHFQLISPNLDIIYSQEWKEFKINLKNNFPKEEEAIDAFFEEFDKVINAINNVHDWHPDFLIGKRKAIAKKNLLLIHKYEYELINHYNEISSKDFLNKYFKDDNLKRLLGSQGTFQPVMNMIHLAFMWNVMSKQGIWFPSCGIHGINQLLQESISRNGGEIKLNTPVKEILIENKKVNGVKTSDDQIYNSKWIIANADYKKVFLELINPIKIPKNHLDMVKNTAYTGSELCVYLGIDPKKVDLSKMRANHLFYRGKIDNSISKNPEYFENKEIEICLWSNKSEKFAPEGRKSLILRVNMPFYYFDKWRLGEKKRKEGYQEFKKKLAQKLIKNVENILPGLTNAVEIIEIATPLTYLDWGQRFEGSVAGWSRDIKKIRLNTKLLTENPIKNLLLVGIYSVLEPFLGGYPVSMYTGNLAADYILEKEVN
jgi:phytoene dehydrogenase-like protein